MSDAHEEIVRRIPAPADEAIAKMRAAFNAVRDECEAIHAELARHETERGAREKQIEAVRLELEELPVPFAREGWIALPEKHYRDTVARLVLGGKP